MAKLTDRIPLMGDGSTISLQEILDLFAANSDYITNEAQTASVTVDGGGGIAGSGPVGQFALDANTGVFSVDHGIEVGVDAQTAVAGVATTAEPNVVVTSEGLTTATSYALTLHSPFITSTSDIQVTPRNSAHLVTFVQSIVCSAGSAVITVGMAALTGTVVLGISVNN